MPTRLAAALAATTLAALAPLAAAQPAGARPAPRTATARAADVLPFPVVQRRLQNGLEVIVVPTGFPGLVSVQIPVLTGSRNEVEPGKTGFAHFFEHMMFRGTKAWPPDRYQEVMTRIGARQNAYTSDDLTNYHVTFAKEDLETVLALEADRFMNLDYPVEAFKTESRAILGEYNKNAANPLAKLDEAQRDSAYRVHTYEHTTMGFLRDIEAMPEQFEYSRVFYDRWYRPEHAAVIVAGDVDPAKVLPLVEKHFGKWRRGAHRAAIPREPEPRGPVYAHVPWETPTLPWVAVAFHGPAFSETDTSWAAVDVLLDVWFGETSDVYRRLVVEEQKVDALFADSGGNVDPSLVTVYARVKKPEDAVLVRDALLRTFARARAEDVEARRLADQKAHKRYAFVRSLDTTERIAGALAWAARHRRSAGTLNALYRQYDAVTAGDVRTAARRWFTDARLVVTTLSREPLDPAIRTAPAIATLEAEPGPAAAGAPVIALPSALPQLDVKLLLEAGSARDPAGKEGLAAVAAEMLADAGSRRMRIDEIREALHPMAATFSAQVDRELVTLTGRFHRDHWERFLEVALPQLTDPGFREEDFTRVKDAVRNALVQDLRASNDEELGKEWLQATVFAGTRYAHPVLGTVAGLDAVTLDDVKAFVREHYTRANLTVAVGGDAPPALRERLARALAALPEGARPAPTQVTGRRAKGLAVTIVEKDTRGTAISMGHPIDVRRGHPDFVALWLARTWLGEHRSSTSHLYQRIREVRGMNYGTYAYVEAFPRGMYQFFPDPNLGRRAQLFEIWIRPVVPENAPMAIRIALHELRRLVREGLSEAQFQATRAYLEKNVLLATATQDQQVGAALDARWHGTREWATYVREGLRGLTREDVNRAVARHLSGEDLTVAIVTKDAKGLAAALASDAPATIRYDAEKPAALLEEDRAIGGMRLGIRAEAVTITPVEAVFSGAPGAGAPAAAR
jgi:zinc protease